MQTLPEKLVIASANKGKLREFHMLLAEHNTEVLSQAEFHVPIPAETGLTFVENAIIKARNACIHTKLPAIADDSGIEVDALGGKPGIYSARFAGSDASDADNNQKLLDELVNVPDSKRTARYQCVIVFLQHANDPTPIISQGSWEGIISKQPSGSAGFGYDPLFWLPKQQCTAAELDPNKKNRISHRGKAIQAFCNTFFD